MKIVPGRLWEYSEVGMLLHLNEGMLGNTISSLDRGYDAGRLYFLWRDATREDYVRRDANYTFCAG